MWEADETGDAEETSLGRLFKVVAGAPLPKHVSGTCGYMGDAEVKDYLGEAKGVRIHWRSRCSALYHSCQKLGN